MHKWSYFFLRKLPNQSFCQKIHRIHLCLMKCHVWISNFVFKRNAAVCFWPNVHLTRRYAYEPGHEKMCLMPYTNNKGADKPAHPLSLISTFVVCCLDSVMSLDSVSKIASLLLASVAEQASLCLAWSDTPEDTFCHDEAHIKWEQETCLLLPINTSTSLNEEDIKVNLVKTFLGLLVLLHNFHLLQRKVSGMMQLSCYKCMILHVHQREISDSFIIVCIRWGYLLNVKPNYFFSDTEPL